MSPIRSWSIVALVSATLLSTAAYADLVVVKIPNSSVTLVLQGKATVSRVNPLIGFDHPGTHSRFDLPQDGTEVIELPTLQSMGTKRTIQAKGDEGSLVQAAQWDLDHGLLTEFYRTIDALAAVNAEHPLVVASRQIKDELARPIAEDGNQEGNLKRIGRGASLELARSPHFYLVYTPDEKGTTRKRRAEARLAQLEQLFEVFLLKCAELNWTLHVPTYRMQFAILEGKNPGPPGRLNGRPQPVDPRNVYDPARDVVILQDLSGDPRIEIVKQMQEEVEKQTSASKSSKKPRYGNNQPGQPGQPGAPQPGMQPGVPGQGQGGPNPGAWGQIQFSQLSTTHLSKMSTTLSSLLAAGAENLEWEAQSREAIYLFARHTGLFRPGIRIPDWVQDGLAAYFEMPAETGWISVGDVSQLRRNWYLASLQDPDRISLEDIVSGYPYQGQMNRNEVLRASTLSWAAMHYLMKKKPRGLTKFVDALRTLPPDVPISGEVTTELFATAFGRPVDQFETEFREFMQNAKPEYEVLKADAETEEG